MREASRGYGFINIITAPLFSDLTPSFLIPNHVVPSHAHLRDYKVLISKLGRETPNQVFAIRKFSGVDVRLIVLQKEFEKKGLNKTHQYETIQKFVSQNYSAIFSGWKIFSGLHVHHKYYQINKMPWEYPDEALITLCWHCHHKLHENETVLMLDVDGKQVQLLHYGQRCHGAGKFPEFSHVDNGICFRSGGAKYEEFINGCKS